MDIKNQYEEMERSLNELFKKGEITPEFLKNAFKKTLKTDKKVVEKELEVSHDYLRKRFERLMFSLEDGGILLSDLEYFYSDLLRERVYDNHWLYTVDRGVIKELRNKYLQEIS